MIKFIIMIILYSNDNLCFLVNIIISIKKLKSIWNKNLLYFKKFLKKNKMLEGGYGVKLIIQHSYLLHIQLQHDLPL